MRINEVYRYRKLKAPLKANGNPKFYHRGPFQKPLLVKKFPQQRSSSMLHHQSFYGNDVLVIPNLLLNIVTLVIKKISS